MITFGFVPISNAKSNSSVASLENQIQSLSRSLNDVTGDYERSIDKLDDLKISIKATEKKIQYSQAEAEKYQGYFEKRLDGLYRHGNVPLLDVLLNSEDFNTFLQRFELLRRIGEKDKLNSEKYLQAAKEYKAAQVKLQGQRISEQAIANSLASKKNSLESKLDQQKRLLAQLEVERKRASIYASNRYRSSKIAVSTSYSIRAINGFVFPVPGAHSYSNDWHAPRAGHLHQGNDIFAPYGAAAVAVKSGTVKTHSSGNGGLMLYLYGDDGTTYIYMHMSGYARTSGHVNAGEVVAYVGNSGNARGKSAHIHFEVHPGGGGAVNPYPILRSADSVS